MHSCDMKLLLQWGLANTHWHQTSHCFVLVKWTRSLRAMTTNTKHWLYRLMSSYNGVRHCLISFSVEQPVDIKLECIW